MLGSDSFEDFVCRFLLLISIQISEKIVFYSCELAYKSACLNTNISFLLSRGTAVLDWNKFQSVLQNQAEKTSNFHSVSLTVRF